MEMPSILAMEKLVSLDIKTVYTGHGGVINKDVNEMLRMTPKNIVSQ